jgi:hypothetical protein
MKKIYTFRLDPNLIKKLDTFDGTRTYNLDQAIQKYVQNIYNDMYNSNTETIQILKDTITDLRQDKHILQEQLTYHTLPWYQKILLPRPKQKT